MSIILQLNPSSMFIVKKVVFSKNPSKEELPKLLSNSIIPSFLSTYPLPLIPLLPKNKLLKPLNQNLKFKLKDGNNFLPSNLLLLVANLVKSTLWAHISCQLFTRKLAQCSITFTPRTIRLQLWCKKLPIIIIIRWWWKGRWWWKIMWKSLSTKKECQYLIIHFSWDKDKCTIIRILKNKFSLGKMGHTHWTKHYC